MFQKRKGFFKLNEKRNFFSEICNENDAAGAGVLKLTVTLISLRIFQNQKLPSFYGFGHLYGVPLLQSRLAGSVAMAHSFSSK